MKKQLELPDWLTMIGFTYTNEFRRPVIGEWYINKNTNTLCYVYDEESKPCDCSKCGFGDRQIVIPIA